MLTDTELVIFDWDGTLMDSVGRIVSSMQGAALALGLDKPSDQEVRDIIGMSLRPAVQTLFTDLEADGVERVVSAYRDQYLELNTTPTPLFSGVEAMLRELKSQGRQLAVATGKARPGLERVFKATGLKPLFTTSRTADEAQSKPHPDMLAQILAETGVAAKRALMIGDSTLDMHMAKSAGVRALGVSFGVHSPEHLLAAGASDIVHCWRQWPKLALAD
ncbi:HAD-IA family hydrolase [Gallaecimonas sp. GXIMD4217]|uniref:HAD-IA family hydrolase n=1 Tax=Gallaecimonas sp. GXIMD4217 TaxID=3131927 RepID=UPI00311B2936